MATDTPPAGPKSRARLPPGVWALGFVSMFMDISSEMVNALLPVYLVTVLGASTLTVGFIEGIAEATANITKIFSGALSDWLGKRKLLTALGYGLAAVTKPIFPLSRPFWIVVGVATILTLARFSDAFLILRSQNVGLPIALVPVVMVVMNVVYALGAYPAGALSDRIGRGGLLAVGIVCLIVADLILALGTTVPLVMLGVVFWGLHMALTQGLFASLVADTAPEDLRGTAFGVFNFAGGIAMLIASVIAGGLWDAYGPAATFLAGAGFTVVALIAFGLSQYWAGGASPDPSKD